MPANPHLSTRKGVYLFHYMFYSFKGDKFEFTYDEGKVNGRGVYYAANGSSEERNYVNSVMHGPATLFMANGDTEERTYESGETYSHSEFN